MSDIIVGLYEGWLWLDERIESTTSEIEKISKREASCQRLMSVPGIGPIISTAVVAAIRTGEAFDRERDSGHCISDMNSCSLFWRSHLGDQREAQVRSFPAGLGCGIILPITSI